MKFSRSSRHSWSRYSQRPVFRFTGSYDFKPVLLSNDRPMRYTIALIVITFVVCIAIQYFFKN